MAIALTIPTEGKTVDDLADEITNSVWCALRGIPALAGLYAGYYVSLHQAIFNYLNACFAGKALGDGHGEVLLFNGFNSPDVFENWMVVPIVDTLARELQNIAVLPLLTFDLPRSIHEALAPYLSGILSM
jgi:hypothetical protein